MWSHKCSHTVLGASHEQTLVTKPDFRVYQYESAAFNKTVSVKKSSGDPKQSLALLAFLSIPLIRSLNLPMS